jgi:TusA-related sulfurtransferase
MPIAAVLDLGDKSCGRLVMEVMLAMRKLTAGQIMLVRAYDSSVPGDLAAWCRMTGNSLRQVLPTPTGFQLLLQKGR